MQIIYSTNLPPRRGLVYWKPLRYLDPEERATANRWLEERFGTEPLIFHVDNEILTHPANRGLIEQTTGNLSGVTYTNKARTVYPE